MHTHTHTHTHTHIHTYVHMHIYVYIRAQMATEDSTRDERGGNLRWWHRFVEHNSHLICQRAWAVARNSEECMSHNEHANATAPLVLPRQNSYTTAQERARRSM